MPAVSGARPGVYIAMARSVAADHAGIRYRVCVVAMPDAVFGEKACAFAMLREGCALTHEELLAFLQGRDIARFKLPERLEIVSEFPISPAGKILRRELRARIALPLQFEQVRKGRG